MADLPATVVYPERVFNRCSFESTAGPPHARTIGAFGFVGSLEPTQKMNELEPAPELPDDTSIRQVRLPPRIREALSATGVETVGQVREMSDHELLALPDLGKASVAQLRELLGLPSTDGVRPAGKKQS